MNYSKASRPTMLTLLVTGEVGIRTSQQIFFYVLVSVVFGMSCLSMNSVVELSSCELFLSLEAQLTIGQITLYSDVT